MMGNQYRHEVPKIPHSRLRVFRRSLFSKILLKTLLKRQYIKDVMSRTLLKTSLYLVVRTENIIYLNAITELTE